MDENIKDTKKKRCFVITPIGDEKSEIRRHIDGIIDEAIVPALGEEYEVRVAHREFELGSINDRVIRNIYDSDLVIANLTQLNPNVMFEIGMRYSFGKPALVIAEEGTRLYIKNIEDEIEKLELEINSQNFQDKDTIKRWQLYKNRLDKSIGDGG